MIRGREGGKGAKLCFVGGEHSRREVLSNR